MTEENVLLIAAGLIVLVVLLIRPLRILLLILVVSLGAAFVAGEVFKKPRVDFTELLPHLDDKQYREIDSRQVTNALATANDPLGALGLGALGGVSGALFKAPGWVRVLGRTVTTTNCYQTIGALGARFYFNERQRSNVGLIAFVDQDKLLNLENFARCVLPELFESRKIPEAARAGSRSNIRICTNYFVVKHNTNTVHVGYVGSNPQVCRDFCSRLPGCMARRLSEHG